MAESKEKPEKKEKTKLVATVMEVTHGRFFTHKHYTVNVLELPESFSTQQVNDAAEKSAKMAKKLLKIKVRVLVTEEVEINNRDQMRDKVKEFLSTN